ncbi:MAG: S1 RNA-binding domain-containing protein, partial [Myxococcota bacterium]
RPKGEEHEAKTNLLEESAARSSDAERRATEVERAIDALLATWIMRDKVGEEFMGTVAGCAEFGAFVRLDEPYVEGMVPVATIASEFLQYDELRMRLFGRSGFEVGVGDRVLVAIDGVDVSKRQVAMRLVSIHEQHGAPVDILLQQGRDQHPWDRFLAKQGHKSRVAAHGDGPRARGRPMGREGPQGRGESRRGGAGRNENSAGRAQPSPRGGPRGATPKGGRGRRR